MKFTFYINNNVSFRCNLECVRCVANNSNNGRRCMLQSCIGTPYCWIHLLSVKHLRIKSSEKQGAGKGLFAMSKEHDDNEVVFRAGDIIIEYDGEKVQNEELDDRYGDYTAPYGLKHGRYVEDGGCRRGAGTLANHAPRSRANARFSFSTRDKVFRLVATKNIRNNKEIFCFYGRDYQFNEPTSHKTK